MRNLFEFLRKRYFYFLFLVLETISLFLLVGFNEFQQSKLAAASHFVSGSVNTLFYGIGEYFSLRKTNKVLIEELAHMHARMPEAFYKTDTASCFWKDSITLLEYRYIGAKVISNSTNKRSNFLMINKGKLQGVQNHMGVVIGNKIVGQVVAVSPHFSWIMSILNKDSRISGKFKKNNQLVNIEWNGSNYTKGQVKEIPKHVVIKKGDTIVTSGNSNVFPEGLLIGTICDFKIVQDENFNSGTLLFSTDFNSLGYVEVVIDKLKKEKEDLQNSFKSQ